MTSLVIENGHYLNDNSLIYKILNYKHLIFSQNLIPQTTLQRKKSMPDFQELPRATGPMSREEVSALGSARREEVRRQADRAERLRANPLLYLVSPEVKVSQCK